MRTQLTHADQVPPEIAATFTRESSDPRVWALHGFGIKITVEQGHLAVSDGLGPCRRKRRLPTIDRTLRRIVITGLDGYVTLAALQWCRRRGIAVLMLNPYGELAAASAGDEPPGGPTIRAQALCMAGGPYEQAGIDISRLVIGHKLHGQAKVASDYLDNSRLYLEIHRQIGRLGSAKTIDEISKIEATAASAYFAAWRNIRVLWDRKSQKKIPDHWNYYSSRSSVISGKNHTASDPANAILNYSYKMLEVEAKLACLASGLHPALGYLHQDKANADSLAYDLMEVSRPEADKYVLSILAHPCNDYPRTFSRDEFTDINDGKRDGNVRLVAPFTHEISERALSWADAMYPVAEEITDIVSRAARGKYSASRISRSKRSEASDRSEPAPRRTRRIPACVTDTPWLEVIPASLWDSISSLADSLPAYGSRKEQVDRHQAIAALAYIRANEIPQSQIPPGFLVSRGSLMRRWQLWKQTDEWVKIESVILEYHRS